VTGYEKTQDQKPCCAGKWEKPQYIVEPPTLLPGKKKKKTMIRGLAVANL
jgi:hypothetical protein